MECREVKRRLEYWWCKEQRPRNLTDYCYDGNVGVIKLRRVWLNRGYQVKQLISDVKAVDVNFSMAIKYASVWHNSFC